MIIVELFFWVLLLIPFYSYIGYPVILFLSVQVKRLFIKKPEFNAHFLPNVTLLVTAYNEENVINDKIANSLELVYPRDKFHLLFVTDGSTDETTAIIKKYPDIQLLHEPVRMGKIAAVERAMQYVKSEIVIFTDANTFLNREAVKNLVRHFQFPNVGAVAGEKRILIQNDEEASGAGEGIYWKYESKLKSWDADLHSVVGAAGELFALRTALFEPPPQDTLIEDFYLSLKIAQKNYKVAYESQAYAMEAPSASVKEEFKRKVRIAAGGIQAIWRLKALLNFFKYGLLSFQYISHRVLRWTLAPLVLPFIFLSNAWLAYSVPAVYQWLLACQVVFYTLAGLGYLLGRRKLKIKVLFVPFYFCMMNFAVYKGFVKYLKGSQSVLWEKAERRQC